MPTGAPGLGHRLGSLGEQLLGESDENRVCETRGTQDDNTALLERKPVPSPRALDRGFGFHTRQITCLLVCSSGKSIVIRAPSLPPTTRGGEGSGWGGWLEADNAT